VIAPTITEILQVGPFSFVKIPRSGPLLVYQKQGIIKLRITTNFQISFLVFIIGHFQGGS
jgi:hypothetical protein